MKLIEDEIPGIRSFRENYYKFINSLEIIVPISLDKKWDELSRTLVKKYNEFVEEKNIDLRDVKLLWGKKNQLEKEIYLYIEYNRDNKFVANKNVFSWLLKNNQRKTINMIKEDEGYIKWRTAHRIKEKNFMKEIINDLAKSYKHKGIEPLSVRTGSNTVSVKFEKDGKSIVGTIKFNFFIMEYAGVLFGKEIELILEDVYSNCQIDDEESKRKILHLTENSNYKLSKKYIDDGELIYVYNEKYLLCDLNKVINIFKRYYFSNDLNNEKINKILTETSDKIMNKEEFAIHEEIKAEAKKFNR